jgi:hypothetical protein
VLGSVLAIGLGTARARDPQQAQLKWGELQPHIAGKKVALALPDGTAVEGKVRQVEADGLQLKITKTSDRKAQPKGVHLIPRQSVTFLRVTEYRWIGRLLCTVGAIGATAGIVAAQHIDVYEGAALVVVPVVVAGGSAGVGVAGYYIGKKLDKRVTEIRIVKE